MIRYGKYFLGLLLVCLCTYLFLLYLGYPVRNSIFFAVLGFLALPCGVVTVGVVHWLSLFLRKLGKEGFTFTPRLGFTLFFLGMLVPTLAYLERFPRWLEEVVQQDRAFFFQKTLGMKEEVRQPFLREFEAFSRFYYREVAGAGPGTTRIEPLRDLFLELKEAATAPALSEARVQELTARMAELRSRSRTAPQP